MIFSGVKGGNHAVGHSEAGLGAGRRYEPLRFGHLTGLLMALAVIPCPKLLPRTDRPGPPDFGHSQRTPQGATKPVLPGIGREGGRAPLLEKYGIGNTAVRGNDGFQVNTTLHHPALSVDVTLGVLCDFARFGQVARAVH
jgi:hypothetical protein